VWLTGVNPIVDPRLAGDGTLTFANAAVDAGAAEPPTAYRIAWARYDNDTGTAEPAGGEIRVTAPRAKAPASLLERASYVLATVRSEHREHPAWSEPVRVYFRREGGGWKAVGLFREE
jgi:hypothetical protein